MKKISFCFLLIILSSCKSSTDSSSLRFAYNENFILDDSDKSGPLSKEVVAEYENINGILEIDIPLNKYVYNPKYKIYFGVSLDNNIKEVAEAYSKDEELILIDSKKVKDFYNLFCKKNNLYMIKTLYNEKKEKMPVILTTVSNDSLLIKKMYDENKIINKIR